MIRVVDLARNQSQTLISPIFRSIGTICGFVSENMEDKSATLMIFMEKTLMQKLL